MLFRTPGAVHDVAGFVAQARRLAASLPERRHVAILCQDRHRFAVAFAAALLRGQVALLTGDPVAGTLLRLAEDFPDAYALVDGPGHAVPGDALPAHPVLPGPAAPGPLPEGPEQAASGPVPLIPAAQVAAVVLTSGSTGRPVGTRKCWGELVERSRSIGARLGLREGLAAAAVATVPPAHMYGLELSVLLPLHAAIESWCGPAFFPADVAASLAAVPAGATLVSTPLHLRALLEAAPPTRPPARVVSATAPLDRPLAARVATTWGAEVLEVFGATEVGSIATRRTLDGADWTLLPGVVLDGPEDAPHASAPWAPPRPLADVLERAADGRGFRLLGRRGDLVKRGGRRASLAGLTRVLLAIPGVQDAAFFVPPDAPDGPAGRLAAVAVAPGHTRATLIAGLRAEIDPVFLPRPLLLLDRLPRSALGKLPHAALLALLGGPAAASPTPPRP